VIVRVLAGTLPSAAAQAMVKGGMQGAVQSRRMGSLRHGGSQAAWDRIGRSDGSPQDVASGHALRLASEHPQADGALDSLETTVERLKTSTLFALC
jgi:hypothetical protein